MAKTNTKEREAVKSAYPGPKWAKRVDNMEDDQIVAVYMRLRIQGKI